MRVRTVEIDGVTYIRQEDVVKLLGNKSINLKDMGTKKISFGLLEE